MLRILPLAVELILVVFCLIDCAQAENSRVRNLPKWGWVLAMILVPVLGCIAWLLAGRPIRGSDGRDAASPSKPGPRPEADYRTYRPVAPDDDPEFLRSLKKRNQEHDDFRRKWEEDLKRREDELRNTDQNPGADDS
jgi:phospholipase D-like protein